ncbi:hypothetical protein [Kocuria aegyptia]|uniref:Uncharacterized protein n=1 Tax=Kocuria aegyptia TaxID=330943 RepID=A0ABN2K879_9MICC
MSPSTPRALAVELRPGSPTRWVATYYPMVDTPAGRWADVTWELHQHLMPNTEEPLGSTGWVDLRSSDPDHPSYADHHPWAPQLAAGYTAALALYNAAATEDLLSPQEAQQLRDATVLVPAGQLSEWVLDDLQDETSDLCG